MLSNVVFLEPRQPGRRVVVRPVEYDCLSERLVRLAARWLSIEEKTIVSFMRISSLAGEKVVFLHFKDPDRAPSIIYATDDALTGDLDHQLVRRFINSNRLGDRVESFDLSDPRSSASMQCFYIPFQHGAQKFGVVVY